MKKLILVSLLLLLPTLALAEQAPERPHWSLEFKGGVQFPDAGDWSRFYGNSYFGEYGGAVAYKVSRNIEVGVESTYGRAKGRGQMTQHALPGGNVTWQQVPVNVFVLVRGVFDEQQWLVPYLGGGYTRMFYRADIEGQGRTEGSVDGFHARGGLQFLMDRLEPEPARNLCRDFGIAHTYFFTEARYTRAMADTTSGGSVNIGGTSCLGGLLFEF
ncbi:hypothetical protein GMSM_01410 [Geomonas sp. Red276]